MRLRIDRDELAGAVAWAARALPARPPVPVLAGMLVELAGMLVELDDRLRLSGYDYEVSAHAIVEIEAAEPGSSLSRRAPPTRHGPPPPSTADSTARTSKPPSALGSSLTRSRRSAREPHV